MGKKKVFIVYEKCVQGYETRWEDYHVYCRATNALKKIQDVKTQDMMPIVEEENYEIRHDEPTRFEARSRYDGEKGYVCVKCVTALLEDGIVEHK